MMRFGSTIQFTRRNFLLVACITPFASIAPLARAQQYPDKPITWVIPFSAGGGTDVWGRVIAESMSKALPHQVSAVNIPGASGVVGWRKVLNEPADGSFILQGSPTPIISLLSEPNPPLQPTDVKIVAYVSEFRPLLAVRTDSPYEDWNAFLDFAKKNPGKLVLGATSTELIAIALSLKSAGAEVTLVPYSSTSESVTDFLGGHIDAVAATEATMLKMEGKARVILNASKRELTPVLQGKLGKMPLASELGYAVISSPRWIGLHPDTPDDVVSAVEKHVKAALETDAVKNAVARIGEEIIFTPRDEAQADYAKLVEGIKSAVSVLKK